MFIIGLMSGTSLDGVDVAYCEFNEPKEGGLAWKLIAAETYPYDDEWVNRLANLHEATAAEYVQADVELGHLLGKHVCNFREQHQGKVNCIASHGHTIFHQPNHHLTAQIGDGNAIAAETGLPVIFDFRRHDVALGGQGAPLVPIGDSLLFPQYEACLNLGGFSNISYSLAQSNKREFTNVTYRQSVSSDKKIASQHRVAFDIAPCNMPLNELAHGRGLTYDPDGTLARMGKLNNELLRKLDALHYYSLPAPKSLGKEWYLECFKPVIDSYDIPNEDKLRTVVEHIAKQISLVLSYNRIKSLLVTGGGAHNTFLIERLRAMSPHCEITVPDSLVVDYKEALIFALLGYLRQKSRNNCLALVTGAQQDNIGGVVALG